MNNEKSETNEKLVSIVSDGATIEGNLAIPNSAEGVVVFAHGSGSSRFSPRNQFVAKLIDRAGIATLLIDLLTKQEEIIDNRTGEFRFDIDLLAKRLEDATRWLRKDSATRSLLIGYFGGSTGAAAALIAAARLPDDVAAIVSRGGRPDLAAEYLSQIRAPVLLIVGGNDTEVIKLNQEAAVRISARTKLEIVPGASHLFEEPGKLEKVAELAIEWFSGCFREMVSG